MLGKYVFRLTTKITKFSAFAKINFAKLWENGAHSQKYVLQYDTFYDHSSGKICSANISSANNLYL